MIDSVGDGFFVPRRTLRVPSGLLTGVALHDGSPSSVRVLPAVANAGIIFRDIASGKEIAATTDNITATVRCTAIGCGGAGVQMVEHVLSALSGCGVTDAIVEFAGSELPVLDGSAAPYVAAFAVAGIEELPERVAPLRVTAPVTVYGDGASIITVVPADRLSVSVMVDYPGKPLMLPVAATYYGHDYATEIAPARTYGFMVELEALAARGLAKGGSRENAFGLLEDGSPHPETPMRFPNEPARHKLLDLIGDLMFTGRPICAQIVALRPSHALNIRLASELISLGQ
jgi:UDP-3-O-[3-hydroxymyristoyl] N-acetylglucosamine deacetylase